MAVNVVWWFWYVAPDLRVGSLDEETAAAAAAAEPRLASSPLVDSVTGPDTRLGGDVSCWDGDRSGAPAMHTGSRTVETGTAIAAGASVPVPEPEPEPVLVLVPVPVPVPVPGLGTGTGVCTGTGAGTGAGIGTGLVTVVMEPDTETAAAAAAAGLAHKPGLVAAIESGAVDADGEASTFLQWHTNI